MHHKITRHTFLKQTIQLSTLALAFPSGILPVEHGHTTSKSTANDGLMQSLVKANDAQVQQLLTSDEQEIKTYSRRLGYTYGILSASCCNVESKFYQSPEVSAYLDKIVRFLISVQLPDGTLNVSNLASPPDTAFLVELLCAGTTLLEEEDWNALSDVKKLVKEFLLKTGDGLSTGGVHTPNHRWVISAALARLNALYPHDQYVNRIHDWLGEGIYNDNDGHFPERSKTYSEVIDRALITISRLLDMPELLEPVRKNLHMTYYYMHPNGEVVTTDSRRQDQYATRSIVHFYTLYRYMAINDKDQMFAGICQLIEQSDDFEEHILNHALVDFMEVPVLQQELPQNIPLPTDYEKFFATSDLARIRRGDTSMTIFGGGDWPLVIASGRSNSPDFFSYRKGEAVLKYMRFSPHFFSTGYFRSKGLKKEGDKYVLSQKLEVPYYQPLPHEKRKADGDYQLSPSTDGRFWNKMSFDERPTSNVKTLETTVVIEEINGNCEVTFLVEGQQDVPVTIELCFKEGGELIGGSKSEDGKNYFLKEGEGVYKLGNDSIRFGPGILSHKQIYGLEGEKYSSHFGNLRTDGLYIYLTGNTPFKHTLTFS